MEPEGYLLIVVHGHSPIARDAGVPYLLEENWLFELVTESYLPLIDLCHRLQQQGIESHLTVSLTPCLLAAFADEHFRARYVRYLQERIDFLDDEGRRHQGHAELARLARMYRERFVRSLQLFSYAWGRDLVAAFRHLHKSRALTVLASAATHAYLPLWDNYPEIVDLQVRLGVEWYRDCLQDRPLGFWLPECGFYPGLDRVLYKHGIRYSFLDAHGLLHGDPRPRYGQFAPAHSPAGLAMFARDFHCHDQVWLKDRGYPGDPVYTDFSGDIGFHWDPHYLQRITHSGGRVPTGIRFYRQSRGGPRSHSDPCEAWSRCREHAEHFVSQCEQRVRQLRAAIDRKPVLVALFDLEHFGHWWTEGPTWLEETIRHIACRSKVVKIITAEDYLREYPTNQVLNPSMSSWGYQGYSETWLMGRNHWMYPLLFQELEAFRPLAFRNQAAQGTFRAAFNQFLQEYLLAQSSDWAFMMHAETSLDYAERRVRTHLENMSRLRTQLEAGCLDEPWLDLLSRNSGLLRSRDLFSHYLEALSLGEPAH